MENAVAQHNADSQHGKVPERHSSAHSGNDMACAARAGKRLVAYGGARTWPPRSLASRRCLHLPADRIMLDRSLSSMRRDQFASMQTPLQHVPRGAVRNLNHHVWATMLHCSAHILACCEPGAKIMQQPQICSGLSCTDLTFFNSFCSLSNRYCQGRQ